jgi:hypothetical protein
MDTLAIRVNNVAPIAIALLHLWLQPYRFEIVKCQLTTINDLTTTDNAATWCPAAPTMWSSSSVALTKHQLATVRPAT